MKRNHRQPAPGHQQLLRRNEPAIEFYRRVGAEPVTEWDGFKIAGEAFERLARERE